MLQVVFEKTHKSAKIPTKATVGSACWDVYSIQDATIEFGKVTIVDLGFKVKIPINYEMVVRPRSGLAFKHGITLVNSPGTIDSDYRGPMKLALTRVAGDMDLYDNTYRIKAGDRIAQIKLQHVPVFSFVEGPVDNDTERTEGGFGSTGN